MGIQLEMVYLGCLGSISQSDQCNHIHMWIPVMYNLRHYYWFGSLRVRPSQATSVGWLL